MRLNERARHFVRFARMAAGVAEFSIGGAVRPPSELPVAPSCDRHPHSIAHICLMSFMKSRS